MSLFKLRIHPDSPNEFPSVKEFITEEGMWKAFEELKKTHNIRTVNFSPTDITCLVSRKEVQHVDREEH